MKPINIIQKLNESENKTKYYKVYYVRDNGGPEDGPIIDGYTIPIKAKSVDEAKRIAHAMEPDYGVSDAIEITKEEYEEEISLNEGYEQWSIKETPLNYKEKLETKEVDKDTIDKEVFKELNKVLTDEDKNNIVNYGGYFIKDYVEGEPEYGTSDVSNSSFSEYVIIPISLTVYWNTDDGQKEVPLEFSIREVYNTFNGGYN